ncbi:MAG: hypothetical protein WBG51_20275 [Syntrophobacteria bacterium]
MKIHQILMLAFAGLIVEEEVAQMLVVSQPPPWAFLVFLLSDWWEACATSAAVGGGAPVPRSVGTGPGSPPPTAAEVAQASHQSLRRNTRKANGGGCETTSI